MTQLRDVMAYAIERYPAEKLDELSNARLTKLIYLSDWRHVLRHGRQITDVQWYYDNFGPFVRDVERTAKENANLFNVEETNNFYGQYKKVFSLADKDYIPNLSHQERETIDFIVKLTSDMYWNEFIKLVYSTHPIASSSRYTFLDLVQKSHEYTDQKQIGQAKRVG